MESSNLRAAALLLVNSMLLLFPAVMLPQSLRSNDSFNILIFYMRIRVPTPSPWLGSRRHPYFFRNWKTFNFEIGKFRIRSRRIVLNFCKVKTRMLFLVLTLQKFKTILRLRILNNYYFESWNSKKYKVGISQLCQKVPKCAYQTGYFGPSPSNSKITIELLEIN